MGAAYSPEAARTPQQKELLSLSDSLLAELEQADEYVFGVPMHNFGVPSVLKLWIDQISRVGRTFSYADGAPKGLLIDKKATFIIATGGIYDAQTKMASFNFVEPYLRSVFGFLGVTDATFLIVTLVSESTGQLANPAVGLEGRALALRRTMI